MERKINTITGCYYDFTHPEKYEQSGQLWGGKVGRLWMYRVKSCTETSILFEEIEVKSGRVTQEARLPKNMLKTFDDAIVPFGTTSLEEAAKALALESSFYR